MSGSFIYRQHVETPIQTLLAERWIILYSTEVHWRFQNYAYEFGCQAREAHRWWGRAQKPEHTAATPSEPTASRGRSVSRKRNIRGKSNHGSILSTTVQTLFERYRPSANSVKMKRVVRLETSVCFRITRLMNNHIRSRENNITKKKNAMTRMLWLLWRVYHNWVVYHKIQMHSFLKKESRRSPMQKVLEPLLKGYDSQSLTLRQANIREKKEPSLGKLMSEFLISEVPTLWNLRTGPMKRLNDSSDILRGMGTPGCVNKRAGGKRVCRSEYAYGQLERN